MAEYIGISKVWKTGNAQVVTVTDAVKELGIENGERVEIVVRRIRRE